MQFLLDTNIVSDLVRHPRGRIAARIAKLSEARVCTSIIVASELRYGAAKKKRRHVLPRSSKSYSALSTCSRSNLPPMSFMAN